MLSVVGCLRCNRNNRSPSFLVQQYCNSCSARPTYRSRSRTLEICRPPERLVTKSTYAWVGLAGMEDGFEAVTCITKNRILAADSNSFHPFYLCRRIARVATMVCRTATCYLVIQQCTSTIQQSDPFQTVEVKLTNGRLVVSLFFFL